jgi:hypothetical protein
LVKFPARGAQGWLKKRVFGDKAVAEANQGAMGALEYVWRRTPYNAIIVLDEEYDAPWMREILERTVAGAGAVWTCRKRVEIAHRMIGGDFMLYVDDDADRLREARRGAATLEQLDGILKSRRV